MLEHSLLISWWPSFPRAPQFQIYPCGRPRLLWHRCSSRAIRLRPHDQIALPPQILAQVRKPHFLLGRSARIKRATFVTVIIQSSVSFAHLRSLKEWPFVPTNAGACFIFLNFTRNAFYSTQQGPCCSNLVMLDCIPQWRVLMMPYHIIMFGGGGCSAIRIELILTVRRVRTKIKLWNHCD